jgi:hypothetical protein
MVYALEKVEFQPVRPESGLFGRLFAWNRAYIWICIGISYPRRFPVDFNAKYIFWLDISISRSLHISDPSNVCIFSSDCFSKWGLLYLSRASAWTVSHAKNREPDREVNMFHARHSVEFVWQGRGTSFCIVLDILFTCDSKTMGLCRKCDGWNHMNGTCFSTKSVTREEKSRFANSYFCSNGLLFSVIRLLFHRPTFSQRFSK